VSAWQPGDGQRTTAQRACEALSAADQAGLAWVRSLPAEQRHAVLSALAGGQPTGEILSVVYGQLSRIEGWLPLLDARLRAVEEHLGIAR
jgi:hypothetical protein